MSIFESHGTKNRDKFSVNLTDYGMLIVIITLIPVYEIFNQ